MSSPQDLAPPSARPATHRLSLRAVSPLLIVGRTLNRWALVLALFALWETGVRAGWIQGNLFPAPSTIFRSIFEMAIAGSLQVDIWTSISRVFVGVTIATVLGIALGSLLARIERAAFYFMPLIELLRPISVIAWIPVAIMWFGLGDASSWFIIALGAFFPIFTSTFLGMNLVPRVYLQAAQTMGLGRWLVFSHVLWPSALPNVLSGIRVGLGVGWMCVIAAEMISSASGLGYMIQTARIMIETEQVFAGMIVIGVVGFLMNYLMVLLERKLTHWTQPAR